MTTEKKKEANEEKLVLKSGIVEGNYQNGQQMMAIATLPATEVLHSMLANVLQAPIRTLAGDLNNTISKLAIALNEVANKKQNEAA